MSTCVECGDNVSEDESPYRCSYCDQLVCGEHRLPENHACTGILSTKKPQEADADNRALPPKSRTSGWRSTQTETQRRDPARVEKEDAKRCQKRGKSIDKKLPGSATEPVAKSPDVNPDGSIKREDTSGESESSEGLLSKLLFWRD